MRRVRGFTLLELLLSVSVIILLAGLALPVYRGFQIKNSLEVAEGIVVQTLYRAQLLSQAVDSDASWGVYVQSGSVTLFQGTSYAGRDSDFDEVFDISSTINPSGIQEVVYSKLYGLPGTTGSYVLTSIGGDARTITVNSKGMVEH